MSRTMLPRTCATARAALRLARQESAQAMLEFVFAALLAISFILGIIQIALVFNAHHMVQLAAFNAARAAIVTRSENSSQPEEPVTLDEMKRKAKLAAFITLLPVIPDLHAVLPTSLGGTPTAIQNLLGLNPSNPSSGGGLLGFGKRALGVLAEYLFFIDVKFVRVDQDGNATEMSSADIAAMDTTHGHVEFDDRGQADNNLIKVVVSWSYPLVIPFANRLFFASTDKNYAILWLASHPEYAQQNPLTAARVLSGDPTAIPIWGMGIEYENLIIRASGGNGDLADIARRALYRVPVKASYIMRMQWDRKP